MNKFSLTLVLLVLIFLTANVAATGTAAPDVNIIKIDGYLDNGSLPSFSYYQDGNLTIDFNVFDADNNRLFVDMNYSSTNIEGSGTTLFEDLNLSTNNNLCDSNTWNVTPVTCRADFNIDSSLVTDGNYFMKRSARILTLLA